MDLDEKHIMNEQARITEEIQCTACDKWITGFETIDPIVIDGHAFCDCCASNLVTLRMDGHFRQSDKTKDLVHIHNKKMYYKAYDIINFRR